MSVKSEKHGNDIFQKIHDAMVESFFPAIVDMTESELYRLYVSFLECDRLQLVKKNGETITICLPANVLDLSVFRLLKVWAFSSMAHSYADERGARNGPQLAQ